MTLDDLHAEREIYRILVKLARAMDERNWPEFDRLTTEDVTTDFGIGKLESREAYVDMMRSFLDECGPTQHLLGNVLIEVTGDHASSQCYVADTHLGRGEMAGERFRTLGTYCDEWVKIGDCWLLAQRTKLSRGILGSMDVLGPGPKAGRSPGNT